MAMDLASIHYFIYLNDFTVKTNTLHTGICSEKQSEIL